MSTRGRILENILDKFNLLCLNEKEETYYRAFDGIKSTIDLTLTSITIAPEYRWSKEYELRGSDHFPIFLEDEKETCIIQQQRWSTGRANWSILQNEKSWSQWSPCLTPWWRLKMWKGSFLYIFQSYSCYWTLLRIIHLFLHHLTPSGSIVPHSNCYIANKCQNLPT